MTTTRLLLGSLAIALLATACGPKPEAGAGGHEAEAPVSEHSSAGLPAGSIAAGEKLASTKGATGQACVDCHGKEGAAPIDPNYPKLAGQYHDYIASALAMYRDGRRQNSLMASQAKELTDQQIADLSAYFGSRQRVVHDLAEHTQ
ncbi:MAG: c-type cytochrome [Lysobacter sp.]|nr:MAG: c-type cytochrome [Lysobacter sp.]